MKKQCSIENCERKMLCKSMCGKHYWQVRTHGHVLSDKEKKLHYAKTKGVSLNTGRTHFKKGEKTWNTGIKDWLSDSHKKALKQANTGRPTWNKGLKLPQFSGASNPNWKGGVTEANKKERTKFRKNLQRQVFERDDYTCQICNEKGGSLQVDHIQKWSDHPDLRFDLNNCRTLCMGCHYEITFNRKMPEGIIWGHNLNRRIAKFQLQ